MKQHLSVKPLSVFLVFCCGALELTGVQLLAPILPQLACHFDVAASPSSQAYIMSAYTLGQFMCSTILGTFSDKFGRRKVLLFSLASSCVIAGLQSIISSFWVFCASRFLHGLVAGRRSVVVAYIADVVSAEKMGSFTSLLTVMNAIFLAGISFAGGYLYSYGGFIAPFLVLSGMEFSVLVCAFFWLEESECLRDNEAATDSKIISAKWVSCIASLYLATGCCTSVIYGHITYYPQLLMNLGVSIGDVSLIMAMEMIPCIVGSFLIFNPLSKKMSVFLIAMLSFLGFTPCLLVPLISESSIPLLLTVFYIAFLGFSIIPTAIPVALRLLTPLKIRGKVMGLNFSFWSLFGFVGPVVISVINEGGLGDSSLFYFAFFCSFLGIGFMFYAFCISRRYDLLVF